MKNPQDLDKKTGTMQESMLKMHAQMHKILDAKNPKSASNACKRTGR